MAFAQARLGDADELAAILQRFQVLGPAISHAASQSADELIHEARQWPLVRHLTFDSLGDRLAAFRTFLRVSIRRTSLHRAQGSHPAIGLERAPLIQNG